MKSKITIETNYGGLKTSYRTIYRSVRFTTDGSPYCKIDGKVVILKEDEWNGKPNGEYIYFRKVDY